MDKRLAISRIIYLLCISKYFLFRFNNQIMMGLLMNVYDVRHPLRKLSVSLVWLSLLTCFGGISCAEAQDRATEVDKIFAWADQNSPGCACAVAKDGNLEINRGYGMADLEKKLPLESDAKFDIGSLSKQFVAAASLLLVEEGKISLSDTIRRFIPELPDYGHTITINHLLTHTSGIRDWTGLRPLQAKPMDVLLLILQQKELNFVPGNEWSYSNSGYVLLKEIIERVSGKSFGEFCQQRIFTPLGMIHTSYQVQGYKGIAKMANAYEKSRGGWQPATLEGLERGGGALISTAADLIVWNKALATGQLSAFVSAKLMEPTQLNSGRELRYARGIYMDSLGKQPFWWHSGSAEGYKSLLAYFPEEKLSIAILCNSGDGTNRISFATRIYGLYAGNEAVKAAQDKPHHVSYNIDDKTLKSYTGTFITASRLRPVQLVLAEKGLRIANGPLLHAVDNNRFERVGTDLDYFSDDSFRIHFISADSFDLVSMDGYILSFSRAKAWKPDEPDYAAIVGTYHSEEAGSAFRIEAEEGQLLLSMDRAPQRQFPLIPIARDHFQLSQMFIRFMRDGQGKVVAMDYSNPLLRRLRFIRSAP